LKASAPEDPSLPNVLIVDDVEANLHAMEALLENMGCNLVFAQSGNEALRHLLKRRFAVLLLDVQMPEMDGYEVAHHARQDPSTRDVPIVFLTATTNTEQNVLRGYGAGAVDYLFKPIDPTILKGKIRVFLELHNGRRKLAEAHAQLQDSFSELTRTHGELRETQAQLVHAAKMASIGSLVAGVAHEINNPLAFILSHIGTVRRSLQSTKPSQEALPPESRQHWDRAFQRLSEAQMGLERIRDIVTKLRTFSRLDEGEVQPVNLEECIEAVVTMLRHRFEGRITLTTKYGSVVPVEGRPGLLNQAVMNLVSNAIDAIDGSGTIAIATEDDGEYCVITVTDSGSGVSPEIRDRIMDPFFTTKPVGEGTGLGLSITYSIAERHGGTVELLDAEGGGTKAVLRILHTPPIQETSTD
jgi:two-component system NtrC family sensor kinase